MNTFLFPHQQQSLDDYAIHTCGIPSIIMMENAASGCAHAIVLRLEEEFPLKDCIAITVLCGLGNNGGDGFAIVRHLFSMSRFSINVICIGDKHSLKDEALINAQILENMGIHIVWLKNEADISLASFQTDCIIDAIIGTGGSSLLRGLPKIVVDTLALKQVYEHSFCIAIDIPTGIDGNNGTAYPNAFKADYTCTMFAKKIGMQLFPAQDFCGEIEIISVGISDTMIQSFGNMFSYEDADIAEIMKKRKQQTSKVDYGRVLIIAGSMDMPGAAALCSLAALRSGAGIVELLTCSVHPSIPMEVLVTVLSHQDGMIDIEQNKVRIRESCLKASSIICGPGLGQKAGKELLTLLLSIPLQIPVLIDADAIPAKHDIEHLPEHWILTPHCGEFSRLSTIPRSDIEQNSLHYAKQVASLLKCIIHVKSVPAITTDGDKVFITHNGNPGMATAGAGDVLCGIAGALLAKGLSPLIGMSLASYIHAKAGDFAKSVFGEESLISSDIIASLPHVFDPSLLDSWE